MTRDDIDNMDTTELFDWLRLNTDHICAPVIDSLELRWQLTSSAAKLWFAHAAGDIKAERNRLDERARYMENNV